jgi:hypothetical protein
MFRETCSQSAARGARAYNNVIVQSVALWHRQRSLFRTKVTLSRLSHPRNFSIRRGNTSCGKIAG